MDCLGKRNYDCKAIELKGFAWVQYTKQGSGCNLKTYF